MSGLFKKVLLISPPNPFLENQQSVMRLGLLYLATMLIKHGHSADIKYIGNLSELEELGKNTYDYVGISATTREYPDAVHILNYFKRIKHSSAVIIGGPHATALPDECLRNGFDVVITGEADELLPGLVAEPNINKKIIHAGMVADLNRLPYPDRTLAGSPESWRPFMGLRQSCVQTTSVLLSRGCPNSCLFCGPHFPYRRRSQDNINQELEMLRESGYRGLVIADDLPFIAEGHVRSFCEGIRPLDMSFRCNFHADLLTPSAAKLLAEAGCCRIQFGFESANQNILNNLKKGTNTIKNGDVVNICHEYGIEVKAMFMYGLPGDNSETAEQIVSWIEKYRPDSIQISKYCPLPGSPLWEDHQHLVADYRELSFFNKPINDSSESCNRPITNELDRLYHQLLSRCRELTHIDTGVISEKGASNAI